MPQKDCRALGLLKAAKQHETLNPKKNWFNCLNEQQQQEIKSAAQQVEKSGVTFLSLAKVVKRTFKIDRSPAHMARVLKEFARQ
jgi:uncharacterized protein with ATP-grasp and redox domains